MFQQRTVGGYFRLISELGSGGFGQTFLAEDGRFPTAPKCVVKQLKPQSDKPEVLQLAKRLFEQEVNMLYRLGEHRQIPSIITHFEQDNEFYFVQEYIEGNTFAQELARGAIFSPSQVIEIVGELLEVLAFVHSRDVIHRDIKPANLIRRAADGKTVLIDFGAVKQSSNQNAGRLPHTNTNTIAVGSEGYMPAEQLAGQPRFSSDVYAVGMFAVQLLTQTHPAQLRQNQRTGEWIWQDKAMVNNQIAEFINLMIRFDFRQRFPDAVEALRYLKRLGLNSKNNAANFPNVYPPANPQATSGATQATFFSPARIEQDFSKENSQRLGQPVTAPKPFSPYNHQNVNQYQPNLQNYERQMPYISDGGQFQNTQPMTQYVQPQPIIRRDDSESVLFGSSFFSDIAENKGFRMLLRITFIGIALLFILSFVRGCTFSGFSTQNQLPPAINDGFVPKIASQENAGTSGYKTLAQKKRAEAKTSEDWQAVAKEWKRAEEFYTIAEMNSTDEESRLFNAEEREECKKAKIYAFERSNQALRKGR
jgi:serine/threonine protein kinase